MKYKLILLSSFLFFLFSCAEDKKKDELEIEFDQAAFLEQEAAIIFSAYSDFSQHANKLSDAADSFRLKINQQQVGFIRNEFKSTWIAYQAVSHYEFGPAANVALKSNVNIFATDSTLIENNISLGNYDLNALSNKSAKGFPAIDYLLHHSNDSIILQEFSSNKRHHYLKDLCLEIQQLANSISTDWLNYRQDFKAGRGTDVGSGTGMLINALNQHYERFFRDGKIGIPLGVRSAGIARPKYTEAFFAKYSRELASANLQAMKKCYLGEDGLGLDDYLQASDASELDQQIKSQINLIESKLQSSNLPLSDAVIIQSQQVQELYNEIQKLIVYWKVDMPSRLGILISYQDNDGD